VSRSLEFKERPKTRVIAQSVSGGYWILDVGYWMVNCAFCFACFIKQRRDFCVIYKWVFFGSLISPNDVFVLVLP